MQDKRQTILEKIKANGGFWSYCGYIPTSLDDDSVIEADLVHLDLEDLPLLLQIRDKAHIKRIWKERLVSQGKRMNIRNYTSNKTQSFISGKLPNQVYEFFPNQIPCVIRIIGYSWSK